MKTPTIARKKSKKIQFIIITALVFLVAGSILFFTEKTHITDFIKINKNSSSQSTDKIEPAAKSDFTGQKERPTNRSDKDEGFVTDTNGSNTSTSSKSDWIASSDGVISVHNPIKNSILSTGESLSGESTSKTVSFRLIDSVSGMIAQGKLNVVNNKFSGVFDFKTTASEGRLDVYIENDNGSESSTLEIPIRFKQ